MLAQIDRMRRYHAAAVNTHQEVVSEMRRCIDEQRTLVKSLRSKMTKESRAREKVSTVMLLSYNLTDKKIHFMLTLNTARPSSSRLFQTK